MRSSGSAETHTVSPNKVQSNSSRSSSGFAKAASFTSASLPTTLTGRKIEPLAEMLPIAWKEDGQWKVSIKEKDNLEPLTTIAKFKVKPSPANAWKLKGTPFARGAAKPEAVVDSDDWIQWDEKGDDRTPYIARGPYGLGSVTWIAQDLGDPTITGPNTSGWPYIWMHVFGWANDAYLPEDRIQRIENKYEGASSSTEIGTLLSQGVVFDAKGLGFISLAIFFFIAYWVIAGPGSYFFLAKKHRKEMSWPIFAASAVVATVLTVVVVRLVLRGKPEIHHATNVRVVSGQLAQPTIAFSKIGLYIPQDGDQRVALGDASSSFISYISPMAIPPTSGDNDFPANRDYVIPVHEDPTSDVGIDVPFRSTLKKLQAQWSGGAGKNIRGNNVRLNPTGGVKNMILGTLDNLTGVDLKNIYIAFHYNDGKDYVFYVPFWSSNGNDSRLDFVKLLTGEQMPYQLTKNGMFDTSMNGEKVNWGNIDMQWQPYWQNSLAPAGPPGGTSEKGDLEHGWTFPVLGLFDRIKPPYKEDNLKLGTYVLLRRGARNLNMSPAIAAGELVIMAQTESGQPLPYPLQVNGDKVAGGRERFSISFAAFRWITAVRLIPATEKIVEWPR